MFSTQKWNRVTRERRREWEREGRGVGTIGVHYPYKWFMRGERVYMGREQAAGGRELECEERERGRERERERERRSSAKCETQIDLKERRAVSPSPNIPFISY